MLETYGDLQEELRIIKDTFKTHSHITLITPGYKTAIWMSHFLLGHGIENTIALGSHKWCSVEHVRELLRSKHSYDRKKLILILKIAFWMTKTETGLLDELKFYGEERSMIDEFRARNDEWSIWQEAYSENIKNTPVLITDMYDL